MERMNFRQGGENHGRKRGKVNPRLSLRGSRYSIVKCIAPCPLRGVNPFKLVDSGDYGVNIGHDSRHVKGFFTFYFSKVSYGIIPAVLMEEYFSFSSARARYASILQGILNSFNIGLVGWLAW